MESFIDTINYVLNVFCVMSFGGKWILLIKNDYVCEIYMYIKNWYTEKVYNKDIIER